MQTMALPKTVCNTLDKMNRDFIWGDTNTSKKVHLVNWNTLCKPKNLGGLGLREDYNNNLAMLSKLGWKVLRGEMPYG